MQATEIIDGKIKDMLLNMASVKETENHIKKNEIYFGAKMFTRESTRKKKEHDVNN